MKTIRKLLKRRRVIALLVILFLGGTIFWRQSASSKASSTITTATAKQTDFVKTISSSGKTKANRSVELTFQTPGKLAWVGVKEGDTVFAYQGIAGLDSRDVQKILEKTLRDYSEQRSDFEQAWRDNWPAAADSHETFEHAPTTAIKRILEKNQWDLEKSVLDVELKNLAVEYATLITPIGGIVTRIDTPVPGVNITPASAVFGVSDPTSLVFEATVDEIDVGSLSIGQTATVSLDAFPDTTFSGTITFISYTSELSSGGATVFPVKIAFSSPQNIRIGLNGDVTIEASKTPGALTIPTEAIRQDSDGKYVYKKNNGRYQRVPVEVGVQNENDIIVTAGLNDGDIVVTKGFASISKEK